MSKLIILAAQTAINKMFDDRSFNVCTLQTVAKSLGLEHRLGGAEYEALRSVHCMEWAEMPPELRKLVREKVIEILTLDEVLERYTPSILTERDVTPESSVDRFLKRLGVQS